MGKLFPRAGFVLTTLTGTTRAVVRFYNQRGTAQRYLDSPPGAAATSSHSAAR